jgi:hypothetical protein
MRAQRFLQASRMSSQDGNGWLQPWFVVRTSEIFRQRCEKRKWSCPAESPPRLSTALGLGRTSSEVSPLTKKKSGSCWRDPRLLSVPRESADTVSLRAACLARCLLAHRHPRRHETKESSLPVAKYTIYPTLLSRLRAANCCRGLPILIGFS